MLKRLVLMILIVVLAFGSPVFAQGGDQDTDGDGAADSWDRCPEVPGDVWGCPGVTELALPDNRAVLSVDNVINIEEFGALVLPDANFVVAHDVNLLLTGGMAAEFNTFDLGAIPVASIGTMDAVGGFPAINLDGSIIVQSMAGEGGPTNSFVVWENGQQLYQKDIESGDMILGTAVTPGGEYIATSMLGGNVYLWYTLSGEQIALFSSPSLTYAQMAFDPIGSTFALAEVSDAGEGIAVYNLTTMQRLGFLPVAGVDTVQDMAFSHDGAKLAYTMATGDLFIWELETETVVTAAVMEPSISGNVMSLSWSPDNTMILVGGGPREFVTADNNAITVVDAVAGTFLVALNGFEAIPTSVAFSSDGTMLIIGGVAPWIYFWGIPQ